MGQVRLFHQTRKEAARHQRVYRQRAKSWPGRQCQDQVPFLPPPNNQGGIFRPLLAPARQAGTPSRGAELSPLQEERGGVGKTQVPPQGHSFQ